MKKYLVIIVGWHYSNIKFYEYIKKLSKNNKNVEIFIASHKPLSKIPKKTLQIIKSIKNCRFHIFENIGYDWGAYSQAVSYLNKNVFKYKYIHFIHDDIEIIKLDFLSKFSNFIEKNKLKVVGNSSNKNNKESYILKNEFPYIFEWAKLSKWKINIQSKKFKSVRGSCFMVKSDIFKKIREIPFKEGIYLGFGNWSVRVFGGLVTDKFGKNSLGYISDKYLSSKYIKEYNRGKDNCTEIDKDGVCLKKGFNLFKKEAVELCKKLFRLYKSKKGLKVNLGCGKDYLHGYLNIDCSTSSYADINTKIEDIKFKKNSVSEIIMYHVIEHFNKFKAEELLKKLYTYLTRGGVLIIECPDVVKVSRQIIKSKENYDTLEHGPYGIRGLYGEPFQDMNEEDYHKWGYSEFTLDQKLKKIGFTKIIKEKPVSHGKRKDRDLRIVAIK